MRPFHLYPPFFVVHEEAGFPDAWEAFCCKMLNLAEGRNDIYRRTPPEDGIDLYCASTQTAYQCKSIESGRAGDLDPRKVISSIKSARAAQSTVPWKNYVLCTNVDVTGTAEGHIRAELPSILIRSRAFWQQACEAHLDAAEKHFRRLLDVPQKRTEDAIKGGFVKHYSESMLAELVKAPTTVFLYSNRHDRLYRVPVTLEFKVSDMVHVFRTFFRLPPPKTFTAAGVTTSLSHALVYDGEPQAFSKTLRECGIGEDSIVTYWTTMEWEDGERHRSDVMQFLTPESLQAMSRAEALREQAFADYEGSIAEAFAAFDATLGADVTDGPDASEGT